MAEEEPEFVYFPNFREWARFAEPPCKCLEAEQDAAALCLVGSYFDNPDAPDAVCLSDLMSGTVRVDIDSWTQKELEESVRNSYPNWKESETQEYIRHTIDLLSRTPPVPWIQSNLWPACHGDFCIYTGEWDQKRLAAASPDGTGLAYLATMLREPEIIRDWTGLWDSIGSGWTTVFGFQCRTCGRNIGIDQSY